MGIQHKVIWPDENNGRKWPLTLFRHWVRDVFCCSVFSLASPLPSTASAPCLSGLFSRLIGNIGLSDFPEPCIVGLRSTTFPTRPPVHLQRADPGSPGSRAWSFHTCLRSPTAPGHALTCQVVDTCMAFRFQKQRRHPGIACFRGSILRPCVPLSTLRPHPRGCRRMTQGRRGWLGLRRETLSFSTPCRFSPALSPGPAKVYAFQSSLSSRN